jgi:predicted lactoylglutathione lyase
MAAAARKLFVNVPVEDLDRSGRFFTELDFSFDDDGKPQTAKRERTDDGTTRVPSMQVTLSKVGR